MHQVYKHVNVYYCFMSVCKLIWLFQTASNTFYSCFGTNIINREKLVVGGSIVSVDNPLDCHDNM